MWLLLASSAVDYDLIPQSYKMLEIVVYLKF